MEPEVYVDRRKSSSTASINKSFFTRSIIKRESTDDNNSESPKGLIGLTILYNPEKEVVADLIFVHGLNGGSQSTWTKNEDVSQFWPREWLPKDYAFRDVRIHTFGYASGITRQSVLNIPDIARSLLYSIYDSPNMTHRENVSILPKPLWLLILKYSGAIDLRRS
jgi:hypothetical protein